MRFNKTIQYQPLTIYIAPLVDILLVLLAFFVVTWSLSREEAELDVVVPTAKEGQESNRRAHEIIINVKQDGSIMVNRKVWTEETLITHLKQIAQNYPDQAVVLRGDESVEYSHIVKVLDACKKANIWNVLFATSRSKSETK